LQDPLGYTTASRIPVSGTGATDTRTLESHPRSGVHADRTSGITRSSEMGKTVWRAP